MSRATSISPIQSAFVTGATGLLGNNLVRLLVSRGVRVRALARSREKAAKQFGDLPVEVVVGDMTNVAAFASHLQGVDVIFHSAAFFRDNYKGGRHWRELYNANVTGSSDLLSRAYSAGVRRLVHTSSVGVLAGNPGQLIDETMLRTAKDADDYYLSKILSDRAVDAFLEKHADMWASMVLPGWMVGPGDLGPTSSGQVILDYLHKKLPGIPPATFSVVDARDVAEAHWRAALNGRRGERYLAAGRHMSMGELLRILEQISGVPGPRFNVPFPMLYALAAANELWARVSRKPALVSLASVRLMKSERDRTHFNNDKSQRELGVAFRPVEATLGDTISWYGKNGWLENLRARDTTFHRAGESTC
jgi:nucleoside-diphosphate-sugar epimerase